MMKTTKMFTRLITISVIAVLSLTGCFGGRYRQPAYNIAKGLGANEINILLNFDASGFDVFKHYLIYKPGKEVSMTDIAGTVRLFDPRASFGETKASSIAIYAEPIQNFAARSTPTIRSAHIVGGNWLKPGIGNKT